MKSPTPLTDNIKVKQNGCRSSEISFSIIAASLQDSSLLVLDELLRMPHDSQLVRIELHDIAHFPHLAIEDFIGEVDPAVSEGPQSVVPPNADVFTGPVLQTALSYNDVAGDNRLPGNKTVVN